MLLMTRCFCRTHSLSPPFIIGRHAYILVCKSQLHWEDFQCCLYQLLQAICWISNSWISTVPIAHTFHYPDSSSWYDRHPNSFSFEKIYHIKIMVLLSLVELSGGSLPYRAAWGFAYVSRLRHQWDWSPPMRTDVPIATSPYIIGTTNTSQDLNDIYFDTD